MNASGGPERERQDDDSQSIFAAGALWSYVRSLRGELTPAERREVLAQLFYDGIQRVPYLYRFFTLLSLSVAIASFGLLTDSTAVVIGAMLVAPLMTPIQATAASLVMGWEKRQLQSMLLVGIAASWCVALSFGFGLLAPDRGVLPAEIISRTSPTLLDLGIALAAGAAGAYTLVRKESSAIPGVAVAVALVPPLAVVGLTLENNEPHLAAGALLLFVTNFVAIIFAASLILLITGFAPQALLQRNWRLVRRGVITSIVGVIIISIPLAIHTTQVIDEARADHAVEHAVNIWRDDDSSFDVSDVRVDGDDIEIDLVGPGEPPRINDLTQLIADELGKDVVVNVRWIQRNETLLD